MKLKIVAIPGENLRVFLPDGTEIPQVDTVDSFVESYGTVRLSLSLKNVAFEIVNAYEIAEVS